MNKTDNIFESEQKYSVENKQCGVGDIVLYPHRQIMKWTAVYIEQKYYLADPNNIAKLQAIQQEIELEKQLASQFQANSKQKAESLAQFNCKLQPEYSFVSEIDIAKQKRNQLRAQNELQHQQQLNVKRIMEARNKKKEQKNKISKNLIKINNKLKEDFQSEKMEKLSKDSLDNPLLQSMMSKITPHKKQKHNIIREQKFAKISSKSKIYNPDIELQKCKQVEVKQIKKEEITQKIRDSVSKQIDNKMVLPLQREEKSIFNLKSCQQRIQERAGNSFFYNIHSKIDQLSKNIDGRQFDNQMTEVVNNRSNQITNTNKIPNFQQSQVMINTKQILNNLNKQPPSQKVIPDLSEISKNNEQNCQIIIKQSQSILQQFVESKQVKQHHFKLNLTKKQPRLGFNHNMIHYQIYQSSKKQVGTTQDKEKLHEEIILLKQVIGQLRVEKLKYQTNSIMTERIAQSTTQFENTLRLQTPLSTKTPEKHYRTHQTSGSIFNNFTQSLVQEVQPNHYKSLVSKNFSGKIVRNISADKKSPLTNKPSQKKSQYQPNQIKEEIYQTQKQVENVLRQSKKTQNPHEQQPSNQLNQQNTVISHRLSENNQSEVKNQVEFKRSKVNQLQLINSARPNINQQINIIPFNKPLLANSSEMQYSMPKPLNKFNYSNPPKFTVQEQLSHQKRHQSATKRKLLNNFQQMQKQTPKIKTIQHLDPKTRASRDGLLKNGEVKTFYNPELNKIINNDTNVKRQIIEAKNNLLKNDNNNIVNFRRSNINETKSSKGFRLRKQSESSKGSKVSSSNKSSRSCDCSKVKKESNNVYVPALNQLNYHQTSTPKIADPKLYELEFKIEQPKQNQVIEDFTLNKRTICFNKIENPKFPDPPTENITTEQMILLIKQINSLFQLQIKEGQLQKLIMKKYKNCIMFDLPNLNNQKLVWHYSGKFYLGEWHQSTMIKSGEGMQRVPGKYIYKGQFLNGKRHGSGVMVQQNGNIYEGQWSDGQKHGRGKYYDALLKLKYEGQWKEGKRQGFGYLQIEDQSIYEGTFVSNYRQGYGTQMYQNGDIYKGEYQKGRYQGKGIYKWANGANYQGDFIEGCKHGQGTWKSQIGQLYIGQYVFDKKQGKGRYQWQNGCIYDGSFEQDKKHGNGVLKYPDGRAIKGIWKDNKILQQFNQNASEQKQNPLTPIKSKTYETVTIIKVVQTKPNHLSSSRKLANI